VGAAHVVCDIANSIFVTGGLTANPSSSREPKRLKSNSSLSLLKLLFQENLHFIFCFFRVLGICGIALFADGARAEQVRINYPAGITYKCFDKHLGGGQYSVAIFTDVNKCIDATLAALNDFEGIIPPRTRTTCGTAYNYQPAAFGYRVWDASFAAIFYPFCNIKREGTEGEFTVAGTAFIDCPDGGGADDNPVESNGLVIAATCTKLVERKRSLPPPICKMGGVSAGNPILPASGEKYRYETDFLGKGVDAPSFSRIYRSSWAIFPDERPDVGLSQGWSHEYAWRLLGAPYNLYIRSPEGNFTFFSQLSGSASWRERGNTGRVDQLSTGEYRYARSSDDAILIFSSGGNLQSITKRNGWTTALTYDSSSRLIGVSNGFGGALVLTYDPAGRLSTVATADGRVVNYSYDAAGRLSAAQYPGGLSRSYVYELLNFPRALTGILDEAGARWGTFGYDSDGRATTTELAGGVERYQVNYPSSYSATVIDPLSTSRTYGYTVEKSQLLVTSSSTVSATGRNDAAARSLSGSLTSETDFLGNVTTTNWDTVRDLPTAVTRASDTPEAQTVSTQWNSTFSLPTLVTEAGRTTAYSYDAVGNVLSKTVTETATNKAQVWQWTYNARQLVDTATEPNGAVTSYTYDTRGNVLTLTNALGHVTSYAYDLANRVISATAPNGLVTTYTYDQRDHLLTQSAGGQTTVLTYKPYGVVETVSLPSGLVLTYAYDAAHRLIGWSNNRGESGTYTLDGMGNRTAEQIKDSAGNVAWSVARTINNINRVSAKTEGANQSSIFGYDANGVLISRTNGLNQSTQYGLDGLRRIQSITDAANASATLKYNALDAVTEAKDFKGVVTAYGRDAQGNATTESSADIGGSSTQYDNLGLPSQVTDALGQATTITRDALGRPTGMVFADGKTATLRYDLTANSKGYLSEILDRSGTTEYTRDAFGRVTLKKQTLANGSVQQVSYAYNPNGTLASIGYPNGGSLSHAYDATGRLTGLNWNGNPLVSGIAWNPLGQPTAWTWAFTSSNPKLGASRIYDTAGRLTSTEFSSYGYDAAGRITSLTQNLWQPGDTDPTHSTIANVNVTWSVGYNSVGRITSFNATGSAASDSAGFGYDANGNRSSSTRVLNGQTTNRIYTVGLSSNRLTGFTQTINGSSNTSVTYGYNSNGDLLTDGLRSYTYDAEGRLAAATTGATDVSPTTRYAHNALGQRVFKTEPLYPPTQGDEADPGFMASLIAFFTKLWSPGTTQAEQLGYAYTYDEQGTLIAEVGSGGTNSAGQSQYIYLPTANGPMPIAAVIDGTTYAVHSDHLNTPRKLTNADGQAVWQWGYSAFGEDKPTLAKYRFASLEATPNVGTTNISEVNFNLRYPGQYYDTESGLFYNGYRTYIPALGRYTQGDPIGLDGGWNRFGYAYQNSLAFKDPDGRLAQVAEIGVPLVVIGGCALIPACKDAISELLKHQSPAMSSNWEDELDFKDNGPKNEWQFSRCNTPEDRYCRDQLLFLKATYTKIKIFDLTNHIAKVDNSAVKGMYNDMARQYMLECPYWEKVPLFAVPNK